MESDFGSLKVMAWNGLGNMFLSESTQIVQNIKFYNINQNYKDDNAN